VKIVNIHEAKTHLSRLLQEALEGEDIVIARGNEPIVRLVLVESARRQRSVGLGPRARAARVGFRRAARRLRRLSLAAQASREQMELVSQDEAFDR
jgi:prevent-host-death family protein